MTRANLERKASLQVQSGIGIAIAMFGLLSDPACADEAASLTGSPDSAAWLLLPRCPAGPWPQFGERDQLITDLNRAKMVTTVR